MIVFEKLHDDAILPTAATEWSAGLDAHAYINYESIKVWGAEGDVHHYWRDPQCIMLPPGARALIPFGFKASLPEGYEMQVRPRSGLAIKEGLTIINAPGTIDADYTGEWAALVVNHGQDAVRIEHGQRIAQLVLAKVERLPWVAGTVVQQTSRSGGYGSTGK